MVGIINLSRDSLAGQRKHHALGIACLHSLEDGSVERIGVGEGLMGEVVSTPAGVILGDC